MTPADAYRRALALLTPAERAAMLQMGLTDPGDPYGLAGHTEQVLGYFAPMNGGEVYRCELARRRNLAIDEAVNKQ